MNGICLQPHCSQERSNLVAVNMSNTNSNLNIVEWNQLPWRKIQKAVWKLQKRIFRAYVNGDVKKGRRLQKTLIKSYYNRLLSVRKVTQDNSGKKTAGVDKVKSLTPKQRLELAKTLKLDNKSKPIRRVWIPKPGKDEKRPLGIPVMRDRAAQALAKSALEPEWEASFEENSYGFRPGRSAHDAIEAIFLQIRQKSKYVLDADIAKCFDRINHSQLLTKLNTFPTLRKQIRAWLRADICDFEKQERTPNHQGTPQGGVISPLLSNIALHGMENKIKQVKGASLIRYADDFVIFHENLEKLKQCQQIISEWLAQFDLEIKPEKTKIVNTLHKLEDNEPGFDFLGFNIKQYEVGKYQSGKNGYGKTLGIKTIIKPSKESINRHYQKISDTCSKLSNAKQSELTSSLAPLIMGWCNYYKTVVSKETFSNLSRLTYLRLARWGYRRHPNKSKGWINNKYWKTIGQDTWVFGESKESFLGKHSKVAIKRHTKVKGNKSPFDGDTLYWAKRMGNHPELKNSVTKLLKKQSGKCNHCGLTFIDGEIIETDHIIPKSIGGQQKDNLQLLHKHCHDIKTKDDLKAIKQQKAQLPEDFKW
jgi:RNA-directed DNA polymerase